MTVEERVRATGLLEAGQPVVVLLSGGRDSVCLLHLAASISGAARALHVNYGLREQSDSDELHCRALCERLGVELHVERAGEPQGSLQAWAREVRYAAGHALAAGLGADLAAGHTASDQVETVLYRLAASPGRRALLGMKERQGRLVRPLLGVSRDETAVYCREHDLPWVEDESNDHRRYARNRIRHDLLPVLRSLHPAAEANILRTLDVLRDEAAVLDEMTNVPGANVTLEELRAMAPALRRLTLQRLADTAMQDGEPSPFGRRAEEVLALEHGQSLDLGGGLRARVEYGELRFEIAREVPGVPEPVRLPLPGRAAFGDGEISAELAPGAPIADGTLDADRLAAVLEVRSWRPGDRMRPLGLGGTKSLQDILTDRKVPRDQRHRLPVVVSGGEIAWIPGVATGEGFRVTDATAHRARLVWSGPT